MIMKWCIGMTSAAVTMFLMITTATSQGLKPHDSKKEMALSTPDRLKWVQIRPGNEMAVVYGDPGKAGELYAVRFRFADGFKVPAHWHPEDEHATVLQGTLLLGMGTNWDAALLTTEMKPGTYIFLPKEMPHLKQCAENTTLTVFALSVYSNDPSDEFMKRFAKESVTINKRSDLKQTEQTHEFIDKESGRFAALLAFNKLKFLEDGGAEVLGTRGYADWAARTYRYRLIKGEKRWIVKRADLYSVM